MADAAPGSGPPSVGVSVSTSLVSSFSSRLGCLCVAAGPPAPSFSMHDVDQCIASVWDRPEVYAAVLDQVLSRLSADGATTPLSVRAMLFTLVGRLTERTAAAAAAAASSSSSVRPVEWSTMLAPQLYRLVSLVLPKFEDATANVGVARGLLQRWITQADTGAHAPFKKHQLLNAIKYAEGYAWVPPPPTDSERQERKEHRREKRRAREAAEKRSRKKQKRDLAASTAAAAGVAAQAADRPDDSISRTSSSSSRSRSPGSRSITSRSSSSPSPSPARLRYLNRAPPAHTASEEAAATRFLEAIRASQKRTLTDATLRPPGESREAWEEWRETRERVRRRRGDQEARQRQQEIATAAALSTDAAGSATPAIAATPTAGGAGGSTVASFLTSWLSARNHWKATREDQDDAPGQVWDGGHHELDDWWKEYSAAAAAAAPNSVPPLLPSAAIPHGAQRLWSKLNEAQVMAAARPPGRLLPQPPPSKIYHRPATSDQRATIAMQV